MLLRAEFLRVAETLPQPILLGRWDHTRIVVGLTVLLLVGDVTKRTSAAGTQPNQASVMRNRREANESPTSS